MPYIELSFPVFGTTVAADHSYPLLSAISRVVPLAHSAHFLGILPISGSRSIKGRIPIAKSSRLVIRLPVEKIPFLLDLAGKELDLDGSKIRLGVPQTFALKSRPALQSRLVTIRGFMEAGPFVEAAIRQLREIGIEAADLSNLPEGAVPPANKPIIIVGPRRVIHIKDKTVVGFAVQVLNLNADESITLQEKGIGGRRGMGCGIFLPLRG